MRAFIALEIDEAVRQRVAELQNSLRQTFPRLRWIDPRQMHLTLKFLGEVDESGIADVRGALDRVTAISASFAIGICGTGVFPTSGAPRVVWLGVKDADGALARCHTAIESNIVPLGFPTEDRPFRPHLTLARCPDPRATRDLRAALSQYRHFDAGELLVRHVVFFQSILTSKAPVYEPVGIYELRG